MRSLLLGVAALLAVPGAASAAQAQVRTLWLTETMRPSSVRAQPVGAVQPHEMVAQQGEEEGFLLAVRPSASVQLRADITTDSPQLLREWVEITRVSYVDVRRPSTGTGARAGAYADPLPPQAPGRAGGLLAAPAGSWSAFAITVSVPASQPAGRYAGTVVVRTQTGATIVAQPFAVTVVATRAASGAADPAIAPHDARNFKVLFNFNPAWYRALAPAADMQSQYSQTYNTLWMLARHRAAPSHWQRAYPSADGTYSCSAAAGYLKVFNEMPWWATGSPGAVPVALMPNHATQRCEQSAFEIKTSRSGGSKFNDTVGDAIKSSWFIYRVAEQWRATGVQAHRSYFLNPFDEPSPAQWRSSMPQVNTMVHNYAPGVKVLGTTWPMQRATGSRPGQPQDNSNLRDGGTDDLDGWVVPYFRAWGFVTSAKHRRAGHDRTREVQTRLAGVQRSGGEAWTYDLPMGSARIPQTSIDGPATDARFMFWAPGRDGYNGWYTAVSNRWVKATNTRQTRNPWDDPLSWVGAKAGAGSSAGGKGPHGVVSNGWGSLFYPGYRPQLGLTNPLAQPVSSLRLARMRDGVEDANLMRQFRDRFGQAALNRKLASVLGPLRASGASTSNETFYAYRNAGLALRMEAVRRQLLAELAS